MSDYQDRDYEDVCIICRRPESKTGRMFHLPGNITVCNDCMHMTMETVSHMETADDKQHLLELGYQFHLALISASKNRVMTQLYDSISLQLLKMRERDFLTYEIYKRDSSTHREILNAIIDRNEALAKDLMLKHLATDYADYNQI